MVRMQCASCKCGKINQIIIINWWNHSLSRVSVDFPGVHICSSWWPVDVACCYTCPTHTHTHTLHPHSLFQSNFQCIYLFHTHFHSHSKNHLLLYNTHFSIDGIQFALHNLFNSKSWSIMTKMRTPTTTQKYAINNGTKRKIN